MNTNNTKNLQIVYKELVCSSLAYCQWIEIGLRMLGYDDNAIAFESEMVFNNLMDLPEDIASTAGISNDMIEQWYNEAKREFEGRE